MPIKIEHLNYVYNPKSSFAAKALDDICLDVNDGDFLGVIGHTGSGKIHAGKSSECADAYSVRRDFR